MENIEFNVEQEFEKISEESKYPKGVINNQDYDNYLIFSDKWKNHIQRYFISKDKKVKLDLAQSPEKIEELIKGFKLQKGEIDNIRKINTEIYFLVQKSVLFKKRAFGNFNVILDEEKGFIADELSGCTPLIIELAGRFYKAEEIHKTLCEDMEVTSISLYQVKNVVKENIERIKELQDKYQKDYSDVRLGYKKSRLEELSELYNQRKSIYNKNNHNRDDEKQLINLLGEIKKEVQGDLVINGSLNLSIEEKANEYLQNEMLKKLNISMFVIARLAGKMNINPLLILSRLANSKYAQFTGFSTKGLSPTAISDEISYTSALTYDWGKIEEANNVIVLEDKKLSELPTISEEQQEKNLSLKEKLLLKLKESKEPLERSKEDLKNK